MDLREFIGHRDSVQATDSIESTRLRFERQRDCDYFAILEGAVVVGLCSRRQIGMLLGARYGYALYAARPTRDAMLPHATILVTDLAIEQGLETAFSRPEASLFDDVILVDPDGSFLGLITASSLVQLQTRLLLQKISELETKQREISLKNEQMEEDLRMAREIQLALLPNQYPKVPAIAEIKQGSLSFHHWYQPAGMVSGDFFHMHPLSEYTVGIFICDVMGHGVRSAFVTAMLRTMVEDLRELGERPGALLESLNTKLISILRQSGSLTFATALYLVADMRTDQIRCANAGHPSPLRIRQSRGTVEPLDHRGHIPGPALGIFEDATYETRESRFEPGDKILFYTDGIHEVIDSNDEEFGIEGLIASVLQNKALGIEDLIASVVSKAQGFAATRTFSDDVCLVGMERSQLG